MLNWGGMYNWEACGSARHVDLRAMSTWAAFTLGRTIHGCRPVVHVMETKIGVMETACEMSRGVDRDGEAR